MKLQKDMIDDIIERAIPLINFNSSFKKIVKLFRDFTRYKTFIGKLSYDEKILLCRLPRFIETGIYDDSQRFSFESEEEVDRLLQEISMNLACNGHFSEPRKSSKKGNLNSKNIVAKYIKLSINCKEFFESWHEHNEVLAYVMEFKSIIDNLDHEEKSELLALVVFGYTDFKWDHLVDEVKTFTFDDFSDKIALSENFSGKLRNGYKKYLEKLN